MQEERNLEAEEGVALMMRQSFLQVPHAEEPTQRKNLFRTRIKCKERVCNLLIDSGSTLFALPPDFYNRLEVEVKKRISIEPIKKIGVDIDEPIWKELISLLHSG